MTKRQKLLAIALSILLIVGLATVLEIAQPGILHEIAVEYFRGVGQARFPIP